MQHGGVDLVGLKPDP